VAPKDKSILHASMKRRERKRGREKNVSEILFSGLAKLTCQSWWFVLQRVILHARTAAMAEALGLRPYFYVHARVLNPHT